MSLELFYHPLSSFCWKTLIALYENETPFTPVMVDLGNADQRAGLLKLWPIAGICGFSRRRPGSGGGICGPAGPQKLIQTATKGDI